MVVYKGVLGMDSHNSIMVITAFFNKSGKCHCGRHTKVTYKHQ